MLDMPAMKLSNLVELVVFFYHVTMEVHNSCLLFSSVQYTASTYLVLSVLI